MVKTATVVRRSCTILSRRPGLSVSAPGDQPSAMMNGLSLAIEWQSRPTSSSRSRRWRRVSRIFATTLVPRPGTRSSASRSARLMSTGNRAAVAQRPGELRVDGEVEHAVAAAGQDFRLRKAIEAHQPVGLVKPVLAHQRRLLQGQGRRRIRDRAEGGIIDAPQMIAAIEPRAGVQDAVVGGLVGADDHLRRLAARRKAFALLGPQRRLGLFLHLPAQPRHGKADRFRLLLRRQPLHAFIGRQFDIDRQPVGIKPGLLDQFRRAFREWSSDGYSRRISPPAAAAAPPPPSRPWSRRASG